MGEKVKTLNSQSGSPQVSWDSAGVASSIYVAAVIVQNTNGGVVRVEKHKVMVLR